MTERCRLRLMERVKTLLLKEKPGGMAWNDTFAILTAYAVTNMLATSDEFTVKAHNARREGPGVYQPGGFGGGGHYTPDEE